MRHRSGIEFATLHGRLAECRGDKPSRSTATVHRLEGGQLRRGQVVEVHNPFDCPVVGPSVLLARVNGRWPWSRPSYLVAAEILVPLGRPEAGVTPAPPEPAGGECALLAAARS
jgi:hypothetical protein